MINLKSLISVLLLFVLQSAYCQNDCVDALIICGNSNFTDLSATGPGIEEISLLNSCTSEENNSIWLKINIQTNGTFGFLLTPENTDIEVDFDFFIFGPNVGCSNLGQSIRCSTTNPLAAGSFTNLTGMDAIETDLSEGPGEFGNNFVQMLNVLAGESYYLVIDRPAGDGNFSLAWTGTTTFNQAPIFANVTTSTLLDMQKCDSDSMLDNLSVFDLTSNTALTIGSQPNVTATYHLSSNDATTNANPIVNPTAFQNTINPQPIFIRLTNNVTGCFSTEQFNLTVNILQSPNPVNLYGCEDSFGFAPFHLNDNSPILINGDPNLTVSYHQAENDNINLPNNYANSTPHTSETLWARIKDMTTGCYVNKPFDLIIKTIPNALPAQLTQCDFELFPDGLSTFNLLQANSALTAGDTNLSTKFYLTLTAAQNDAGALTPTFSNTANPQILSVRVIDNTTSCYAITTLTLNVNTAPTVTASLDKCDDDGTEDGFFLFNLTDAGYEVLPNTVVYYANSNDALLEQNPIPANYTNTTANQQTVYVRIENNNDCNGLNLINLTVNPLPNIRTNDLQITCFNAPTTLIPGFISGNPSAFQYLWSPGGETTPNINVFTAGNYSVHVTNIFGCFKDRTITLTGTDVATIEDIIVVDLSDNNTVTVYVEGDESNFDYSIDSPNGPFQDSNYFDDVAPGIHTVYIQDKGGCGIVPAEIAVVGIPKFFTPNADGFNDNWNVVGVRSQSVQNASFSIYDRYGKIIKKGSITSGWDGNCDGKVMPADDYWYVVELADSRIVKGHFALKR